MAKKTVEPATMLVFGILEGNPGQFLTAREILSLIFEKHGIGLSLPTVRDCLYLLIEVGKPIEQATMPMYAVKIPTAVFKYSTKPTIKP